MDQSLVNSSLGWYQEANTPEREDPHWQWRLPNDNVTFMLNPDVALVKDIQLSVQRQMVFILIRFNHTGG